MSEERDPPTLLCWHSVGHGLAVVRHAVALLRAQGVEIARVHYLTDGVAGVREDEVRLEADVRDVVLQSVALDGPTNHASIYRAVRDAVVPRVARCRELHINVSPGTPAMHAVWLVLHAGGAFPPGTQLWSSQRDRDGRQRIERAAFAVSTYLAEIREVQRRAPEDPTSDAEPRSPA